MRPGRLQGNAATRGSGTSAVQLHAEPQAQQQGSTEQPPGQDSAAAPGRPGCGHHGDPGLRLHSRSHPQLRPPAQKRPHGPRAANCGNSPAGRVWARLPRCHRGGPGVTLSCPAGRATGGGLGAHPGDSHRDSKNTFLGSWTLVSFASVTIRHRGGGKVSCQVLHQRKSSIKWFCTIKPGIKIKHTYARVYNFSPSRKEG